MSRRDRIDDVVDRVLRPLLSRNGGDVVVVALDADVLTLRLVGLLQGAPATAYIKRGVIEPAIVAAAGTGIEILYEVPTFPSAGD